MHKFLVIGHPRGGTGYMAMLLQAYGFSVGHEKILADGTSSWMHMVDTAKTPFGEARSGIKYEHVIHVVRHPVKTIASMVGTIMAKQKDPSSLKFMSRFVDTTGKNDVERAVKTYLGWHGLAAKNQPRVRIQVEIAHLELPKFLSSVSLLCHKPAKLPPRNYNGQEHKPLSWSTIKAAVDPGLHRKLTSLARHFGYGKKA